MKKISSLFKRDYEGTRLCYDELVEGSGWVAAGEGVATVKFDGTACLIRGGKLFKRFDRKLDKRGKRKAAPAGWEPCEPAPNEHPGHWPGWVPVGDAPQDRWHREVMADSPPMVDGTYELVGPKVQANPYRLSAHQLRRHGSVRLAGAPRTFAELREWFDSHRIEGIVWHHPDGRMVKIKRRDFGLEWP